MAAGCLLVLLLGAGAGPALAAGELSLTLPEGWEVVESEALGPSSVASFPPLAARADGEVLVQAADRHGRASMFVARVAAPLTVDEDARDALAVAAPEALRRLWGIDARVAWADVVEVAGRPTLQLQATWRTPERSRVILLVLLPGPGRHWVLAWVADRRDPARDLDEAEAMLATVAAPPAGAGPGLSRGAWGALLGAAVGAVFAAGLAIRRRRSGA